MLKMKLQTFSALTILVVMLAFTMPYCMANREEGQEDLAETTVGRRDPGDGIGEDKTQTGTNNGSPPSSSTQSVSGPSDTTSSGYMVNSGSKAMRRFRANAVRDWKSVPSRARPSRRH